jgi:hypothetical protein
MSIFWSDIFMKTVAFKATPVLGAEASKALLKIVGSVTLTEQRKAELKSLADIANRAFARSLCTK